MGRVVGKALHDGQFVDAYFTRSFYKHCLGQPLTYQVGYSVACCKDPQAPIVLQVTDCSHVGECFACDSCGCVPGPNPYGIDVPARYLSCMAGLRHHNVPARRLPNLLGPC